MPALVTGISVSFRLRFCFVRVARAVEAKLRERMTIVVGIAGPPGSDSPGVVLATFRLAFAAIYISFTKCRTHFVATNFFDRRKNMV